MTNKLPRLSLDGIAAALGIEERQARRLTSQGILSRDDTGYDVAASFKAFLAHRERVIKEKFDKSDFGKARASLYAERAEKMRLEREALAGRLLEKDDVLEFITKFVLASKQRLLAVPSTYAPKVYRLPTIAAVATLLKEGIYEAMTDLSEMEIIAKTDPRLPPRWREDMRVVGRA
jgi:hypothetical protein